MLVCVKLMHDVHVVNFVKFVNVVNVANFANFVNVVNVVNFSKICKYCECSKFPPGVPQVFGRDVCISFLLGMRCPPPPPGSSTRRLQHRGATQVVDLHSSGWLQHRGATQDVDLHSPGSLGPTLFTAHHACSATLCGSQRSTASFHRSSFVSILNGFV